MVKVASQINWTREGVYGALSNFADYPKWFPSCEGMVIHSSADNVTVADLTVYYSCVFADMIEMPISMVALAPIREMKKGARKKANIEP